MRKSIWVIYILTGFFYGDLFATVKSIPDSLQQINELLEQEHLLRLRLARPSGPRLSAAESGSKIIHTIIDAELEMKENGRIEARAGLCLEYLNTGQKSLELSLGGAIQVGPVLRAGGDSLAFSYSERERLLRITIPASAALHDTLWISYSGEFTLTGDPDTTGQSMLEQSQVPVQEMTADYAYALGGLWFPSLPDDGGIRTLELNITVPDGFAVAATGDSTGTRMNGDSTVTYNYSSRSYGPFYNTGSFSVARYKQYKRTIGTVGVTVYSLPRVYGSDNAKRIDKIFGMVGVILDYYRELNGGVAYPWKELRIVESGRSLFPLGVADLEWTIYPQDIFNYYPDSLNNSQIHLLAHEIAHQWWGVKVTPNASQSAWLAEGMAEHSARSMVDSYLGISGKDSRSEWMDTKLLLASSLQHPSLALPVANPAAPYIIVYEKGAWIARMLEQLAGEQSFRTVAGAFLGQYSGKAVTLEEYSIYWQSRAATLDLSSFFSQWFYKAGTPHYLVRGHKAPEPANTWQASVTQLSEWDMPVDLALYYRDGSRAVSAKRINQTRNEFVFTSASGLPDSVRLDPDNKLLSYNVYPPNLSLTAKPNTINVDEPAWVAMTLDSLFPRQSARLNWRMGEGAFQPLEFDFSGSLTDTVLIPASNATARIDYYLEVHDAFGQVFNYPDNAPDSLFSYYFTEYGDLPEDLVWASFSSFNASGIVCELSIYDLKSGLIMHTYLQAGGCISVSPNNKYLICDNYLNNELVLIELKNGTVLSRTAYNPASLFNPQRLSITNDGKTVFMEASTSIPLSTSPEEYRISIDNKSFRKLDKTYTRCEYNPLDNKMYMKRSGCVDVFDIANDVFCDSIPLEKMIDFASTAMIMDNYHVLSEFFWGGYGGRDNRIILKRRNLFNGKTFETLTLSIPELNNALHTKAINFLMLPNSTRVAFLFKETNHYELNFWDLAEPGWHKNVVLEGSLDNTSFGEMKISRTGKKLIVSNIGAVAGTGPCLAVVSLETFQVERYLYAPDGHFFDVRFETEHPHYNETILRGDGNLDGKINVFDLLALLGNLGGSNQAMFFESDVNADGKLDVFDLLALLRLLK